MRLTIHCIACNKEGTLALCDACAETAELREKNRELAREVLRLTEESTQLRAEKEEAEKEKWRALTEERNYRIRMEDAEDENAGLRAQLETAKAALEFYSDTFNIMDYCKQLTASTLEVDVKVTERAREVLSKLGEKK